MERPLQQAQLDEGAAMGHMLPFLLNYITVSIAV
jgi:hypothetical protein